MHHFEWSVFTKPWPSLQAGELGTKLAAMGFDGIELPVRDGFQVTPADAERELPEFARRLTDSGIHTFSVAATLDEPIFAACAAAGIPMIRIMVPVGPEGYLASERSARAGLENALSLCERYQIRVGIQQHHGRFVSTSAGLRRLVDGLPARYVCVVWDAAHDALAGEDPDLGLEQVWSHLGMVNLKNACYRLAAGSWRTEFVDGASGLARWADVGTYLAERAYSGVICLTAQYTDPGARPEALVAADLRYAKTVFHARPQVDG